MADDFKALVEEQKRTTRALLSVEDQAAMDAAIAERQHTDHIKNQNRIEGGQKAWQTRKENQDAAIADDHIKNQNRIEAGKKAWETRLAKKEESAGASADAEAAGDQSARDNKMMALMKSMAGGIKGMYGSMKDKAKKVGKGIWTMLKATLLAGFFVALLAFLESDAWARIKKTLVEDILPGIIEFGKFLFDNWEIILASIIAVKAVLVAAKIVSIFNKVKAGYILLKASTTTHILQPLQNTAKQVAGKIWKFMKLIPPALTAIKVFFMSTFLPAVTAFMIPLLPIIAIVAAISLALYALWEAFEDAQAVFDETGSITEALTTGYAKFMATILGFIPDMVLKLVGWVAGLFGFDDFKSKVQTIDVTQWIADTIKCLLDNVIEWFKLLFEDPMAALKQLWTGILGGFKSLTDILFWPVNQAIAWVQKLFGWGDPEEPFTVQKAVAEVWAKVKTWFTNLFKWAETEDTGDSWIVGLIKDLVTGVKCWLGSLFTFDGTLAGTAAGIINIIYFIPNMVAKGILAASKWLLKLFGFDKAAEDVANPEDFSIGGLIVETFKKVKKWIMGIFGFGNGEDDKGADPMAGLDEGFSISKMISDVVKKIKEFFFHPDGKSGLLQFDLEGVLPDFEMPDFGGMIKGVIKSVFPTSLFDKTFFGYGLADFLPDSLTKFLTEPDAAKPISGGSLNAMATGGSFTAGQSMLVGELGPELILPSTGGQVKSAERTKQMQDSALQKSAGAAAGTSFVNAPVNSIKNTQSNTTNTSTSLTHPNPILNAVNVAA